MSNLGAMNNLTLKWTIVFARLVMAGMFLLFGEYKLFRPEFAHGGMQHWLNGWIDQGNAVSFYLPFLKNVVVPHATAFAYFVGVGEFMIGISLLTGVLVRPASIAGAFFMVNLILAEWNGVGASAPLWQYFGAQLGHICPLLLFLIFFAEREPRFSLQPFFKRPGRMSRGKMHPG